MPSTRSYPSGTHVMTTNGSGICWFTCASTNEAWSFTDLSADILHVRTTAGTLAQVVPRTITIPTVGTLTILTFTT